MGTMERMRQTSPYILAAFAIIFVGFMVASDADVNNLLMKGENMQTAAIAEVNGNQILYMDYEARVKEREDQQRQQMKQQSSEAEIDYTQIRKSVWNELIEERLLAEQSKEMGVFVTKEEILDVMLNNPPDYLRKPFTDSTGNFQRQNYVEIMTNPNVIYQRLPEQMSKEEKDNVVRTFRNDIIKIEKALMDEKLRNGINNTVNTALSIVPPLFAREKFVGENSNATVNFILVDVNGVNDPNIKVADSEIRKYYDENKKLWPQKPVRKIKYMVFPIVPSAADTAVASKSIKKVVDDFTKYTTPAEINTAFSKRMEEFKGETHDYTQAKDVPANLMGYLSTMTVNQILGPLQTQDGTSFIRLDDRRNGQNFVVKASHILIEFGNNKDSAKAFAEKIKKDASSGDFAKLAMEFSADPGSGRNGGDLGYFSKGQMVPEFENAAFGASSGQIVGPIETKFGWHIIKVVDKQSDELKYSVLNIKPQISRMTTKAIGRNAKESKERLDKGEKIEDIAKFFNTVSKESEYFNQERPVLNSNFIAVKAFELDLGEVIDPTELKNIGLVVAQVSDIQTGGVVPFESIKEKIKAKLLGNKKLDALKSKAENIYSQVSSLPVLSSFVSTDPTVSVKSADGVKNNGVVPGFGQDYPFTIEAFRLPLNQISKPVRGERGYYIIQVVSRTVPSDNEIKAGMNDFLVQLRNQFKSAGYYQWFNKLKEDSDIKDFRTKFFTDF
jgi:parvulin-like peptidyl-prolyl isomerase